MLTVRDAKNAIEFYRRAFGAAELSRQETPTGQIVAELVDENVPAKNTAPATVGATTVRLSLVVDDPDAAFERAIAAGGAVVFPLADQVYGMRQGRIADPSGHHWLIGKYLAPGSR
jgi:PhnB protein